jgi:hypothetical protein
MRESGEILILISKVSSVKLSGLGFWTKDGNFERAEVTSVCEEYQRALSSSVVALTSNSWSWERWQRRGAKEEEGEKERKGQKKEREVRHARHKAKSSSLLGTSAI